MMACFSTAISERIAPISSTCFVSISTRIELFELKVEECSILVIKFLRKKRFSPSRTEQIARIVDVTTVGSIGLEPCLEYHKTLLDLNTTLEEVFLERY